MTIVNGLILDLEKISADQIQQALKSKDFRQRMRSYIKANIRAYLPGLEDEQTIKGIPAKADIAFNRPPNPDHVDYDKNRRAPFHCSPEEYVTEEGEWGPKRLYGYVNAWNPDILINARCNNDLKILTHGRDARNITFYVTSFSPNEFTSSSVHSTEDTSGNILEDKLKIICYEEKPGLENWNVLDFLVQTYEEEMDKNASAPSRWGRHRNERYPYLERHWKARKKTRADGFLVGTTHRDCHSYYCANMLLLLKTWRNVKMDLKANNQSWEEAFHEFLDHHSEKEKFEFVLSGIQFYHECNSAAKNDSVGNGNDADNVNELEDDVERGGIEGRDDELQNTQDSIDQIREAQLGWPERQYAQQAIDVARLCGVFQNEGDDWFVNQQRFSKGTESEMDCLRHWKDEMQNKAPQHYFLLIRTLSSCNIHWAARRS
ncbi:hypothetical protein F5887DRAFT_919928 [Amanita rubescens]|nr:hypothetical protein F5887DRAFT_919928 [Amanita rubescens]